METASVATEPLYVRLDPNYIRDSRVFWFCNTAPLTVSLPIVNGEVQEPRAADESSMYPHPRATENATQP